MISLSFRSRILIVVVAVATVPLVVIGLWLTGQTARSGEALLRERLEMSLVETADDVAQRWIPYRSSLLDLVETEEVRAALDSAPGGEPPTALTAGIGALDAAILGVVIRDADDSPRWSFARRESEGQGVFGAPLVTRLPIFDVGGRRLGTLEARIRFLALRPSTVAAAAGAVVSALDPRTGSLLLPVPFDPTMLGETRFRWNGEDWIGRTREVPEPRVRLAAAAPVAPFVSPFEQTARRGLLILLAVAALGLLAAVVLTSRLTASLERLAAAARAVSAGDFSPTVEVSRGDEVGAVAAAFNTMVTSLRRMMRQLAEQESLAAVNEFAASMAHEIRNPLTSIQLDLQQVEEDLPEGSSLRALQEGAIEEIRRLDRTVADSLDAARSGRVEPRPIDVMVPLRKALQRARPHVEEEGASLEGPRGEAGFATRGDPDALEQLFLNLILNAAHAVSAGGKVTVTADESPEGLIVSVHDDGCGIADADRDRIFEPFFTTRAGGTGLGLAVARRIAAAHWGEIRVRSEPGRGTTFDVELPGRADTINA